MDIGLRESRVGIARYYHLEPGDGTRYEFLIMRKDGDNLYCAEVNTLTFRGYIYRPSSILPCMEELKEGELSAKVDNRGPGLIHPYLGYIADKSHCNPWTARAAVFAMWRFLQDEKEDDHGIAR